jgi:hypothetical protein
MDDLPDRPATSFIHTMIEWAENDVSSLMHTHLFTYAHHKFLDAHSRP